MRKRNYIGKEICGVVQEIRQREFWKKIREIIGNLQLVVRIRGVNIFKNIPPYPPFKLRGNAENRLLGFWMGGRFGNRNLYAMLIKDC